MTIIPVFSLQYLKIRNEYVIMYEKTMLTHITIVYRELFFRMPDLFTLFDPANLEH